MNARGYTCWQIETYLHLFYFECHCASVNLSGPLYSVPLFFVTRAVQS